MVEEFGLIGFGEAGSAFAGAAGWGPSVHVFDIKVDGQATRDPMLAAIAAAQATPAAGLTDALRDAGLVLSLVTADQALYAAEAAAAHLAPGAVFCDMNSVAPQTKEAAARAIEAAGGHYVDVAIMAPVDPLRMRVPLLVSGALADAAARRLAALGFENVRIVGAGIGRASSIKMIRSVMVKGIEALTAECVLAAQTAGVLDEVLASLDASETSRSWALCADYNLDRMLAHGMRRAAEMEEVVKTLEGLGGGAAMTRGTVWRQRAIGLLGVKRPPQGLAAKIDAILGRGGRAEEQGADAT